MSNGRIASIRSIVSTQLSALSRCLDFSLLNLIFTSLGRENEVNKVDVCGGLGLLRLFSQKNKVENKVFIDEPANTPAEKYLCRYYWY